MVIKWTKTALASVDEIAGFIAKDNPARVSWSCTRTTSPFTACVAMTLKF